MESLLLHVISLLLWINELVTEIHAACSKPTLATNSYTLTDSKNNYATNETYEIYCSPGYLASGSGKLVCGSNNQWSLEPPTCTPAEGTYPWWMLLVAVTTVILLVSCILPRFLQCCCGSKSGGKKKGQGGDEESGNRENDGYSDDDDEYDEDENGRSNSPPPNFRNHKKMSNMEFMVKLDKDVDKKTLKRATKNAVF